MIVMEVISRSERGRNGFRKFGGWEVLGKEIGYGVYKRDMKRGKKENAKCQMP
jgi:hypothetical protein